MYLQIFFRGGRNTIISVYNVHNVSGFKAKMGVTSSDTQQLQFIKLHNFKQERFQSI